MGNIRTPKIIYKNGFVMSFKVINKEIHYTISKWDDAGSTLALLVKGKLNNLDPNMVLQSFMTETKGTQKFTEGVTF